MAVGALARRALVPLMFLVATAGCAGEGLSDLPGAPSSTSPAQASAELGIGEDPGAAAPASSLLTLAPPMIHPRAGHGAVLLSDGRVLVAGDGASAEIYDPVAGAWSLAAPMSVPRSMPTLTLLPDGRVFVATGAHPDTYGEIYDPASDTWTITAPMLDAYTERSQVLLPDARVLVAGGRVSSSSFAAAEIYDPSSDTWTAAAPMTVARHGATAILLSTGKVLVAGPDTSAELYDPATNTWSATGAMALPRYFAPAALLPDGRVMVVFGHANSLAVLPYVEIYDPAAGVWTSPAQMPLWLYGYDVPQGHTVTSLPSGRVLVTGGSEVAIPASPWSGCESGLQRDDRADMDVYDPVADDWLSLGMMSSPRGHHTATRLLDGSILIAGGHSQDLACLSGPWPKTSSVELYTRAANGAACSQGDECASGHCVDFVCCESACSGLCDACSVAAGASQNGVCEPVTGTSCNDASTCTQGTCMAGVCLGGGPSYCVPADSCHEAACDPILGCVQTPKPDGGSCSDGNACTQGEVCQAGGCTGGTAVVCTPVNDCHHTGCHPLTGQCMQWSYPDGTPCDDGDGCTQADHCEGGTCTGNAPDGGPCGNPGDDAGVPGDDAGVPGDDDAGVPGDDAGVPGDDAGAPGDDAGVPGDDAGVPGDDAGAPGDDAGVPGGGDAGVPGPDLPDASDASGVDGQQSTGGCSAAGRKARNAAGLGWFVIALAVASRRRARRR